MKLTIEDLEDKKKFRQVLQVNYSDLAAFILNNIRKKTVVTVFFWIICTVYTAAALYVRIVISGSFQYNIIILHSLLGFIILPLVSVPVHEFMHVIPFYLSGARKIRIGMDLRQYMFFVTAHKFVAGPLQFIIVALVPFLVITVVFTTLVFILPGNWKWSITLFLFMHSTMCAGDFALLNFYWLNRDKNIYTWDDADRKISYFYEKLKEY